MASRLLLFSTPLAVLIAVLQVPANSSVVAHAEVQLAPLEISAVTESGDYVSPTFQLVNFDEAVQSRSPQGAGSADAIASRPKPTSAIKPDRAPASVLRPAVPSRSSVHNDIAQLRVLSQRYWADVDGRPLFERDLFDLASRIYLSDEVHYLTPHIVQPNERLADIAKRYRVPWEYLADVNRVEPTRLRAGSSIKISPGPFHAIVERSQHRITVHSHGYVVAAFAVGLGRADIDGDSVTPIGQFTISDRVTNPTWYGPNGVVAGDDPLNPLGEYWLGLADANNVPTTLGIHGTLAPHTVGENASRGCVRLNASDIKTVFRLLDIGSAVEIRD